MKLLITEVSCTDKKSSANYLGARRRAPEIHLTLEPLCYGDNVAEEVAMYLIEKGEIDIQIEELESSSESINKLRHELDVMIKIQKMKELNKKLHNLIDEHQEVFSGLCNQKI